MNVSRTASRRQMEEERDYLLRSISDLDRERSENELTEADHRRLRDDYTARAADVIRRLEALDKTTHTQRDGSAQAGDSAQGAPAQKGPQRSWRPRRRSGLRATATDDQPSHTRARLRRGLIALAIILCFVAAAAALVVLRSGNRMPGQTASGSVSLSDTQRLAQELTQARVLSSQGKDLDAIKLYDQVLKVDPRQPEALAYRGWLLRLAGVASHDQAALAEGRASVADAVARDPSYPDARAFLGYILFQDSHDSVGAVEQFRAFLNDHPQAKMVELTRDVVAQAFAAVGQPVPPPTSSPAP